MLLGQSVDWPVSRFGRVRLGVGPAGPVGYFDFYHWALGANFLVLRVFGYQ